MSRFTDTLVGATSFFTRIRGSVNPIFDTS
jgi:hypothetical protein